ncbi:MAG: SIR2 family protein [Bacteroidales bacterium]|nr:SIR2 family protein [Bacteroidales bacterium]
MRKKVTILLGSGAAIPWEGPTSSQITDIIIKDKYYHACNGKPIGEYIFNEFEAQFDYTESINFETILTLLESIFDYYNSLKVKGSNPNFTSIWPFWFNEKGLVNNLKDFEIKDLDEADNREPTNVHYRSPISSGNSWIQWPKIGVELRYFSDLISRFNGHVSDSISNYDNKYNEKGCEMLNKCLLNFIMYYISNDYVVRIYTTNYDRLIPKALNELNVFDGFLTTGKETQDNTYSVDFNKIINDDACLNYFNLHGSIYWRNEMNYKTIKTEYFCNPSIPNIFDPILQLDYVDPGRSIILSNIVTGYNKTHRVSIPPLNYFEHAFCKDLLCSDELITIGNGFGDLNINKNLKMAFLQNIDLHYLHISKGDQRFLDSFQGNKIRDVIGHGTSEYFEKKVTEGWVNSSTGKHRIYLNGFESFLHDEGWRA